MPLVPPTEPAVARFVEACRGDNESFSPISPRQVVPTLQSLAANAVMAGCKPEYLPVVPRRTARASSTPTTTCMARWRPRIPARPMMLVSGPLRHELSINCGSNCFGQGWRANATIGRALGLILLNVGGAKPAIMDRSTHGLAGQIFVLLRRKRRRKSVGSLSCAARVRP